jgi:hypothetical protein
LTERVIWTAASTSATLALPPNPMDGTMLEVVNASGGAFTQMTVTVSDGSTLVGPATTGALANGASVEWQYVRSTTSWYRMR